MDTHGGKRPAVREERERVCIVADVQRREDWEIGTSVEKARADVDHGGEADGV